MAATPLNPTILSLSNQSYHSMLQESIHHFLSQLESGVSDYTHFNTMFSRMIQTMPSPPIEVVWFYAAVNFHTHIVITAQDDKLGKISALKELFQLLISCTGPCCSSLKRVAVLAPLVLELHNFVCELKLQTGLSSDNVVVEREVGCLVERLVSFISMCCLEGVGDHDDTIAFSPCFVDLVKVWTVRRWGSDFGFEDNFRIFFPIIGDEVRNTLLASAGVGVLAGIVMCQTFLLSLCLKLGLEEPPKKPDEGVLNLAVNTITGFRSCYFFDILLKVLLSLRLPVTPLLTAVDEIWLREVLFDAMILTKPRSLLESLVRLRSQPSTSFDSEFSVLLEKAMHYKLQLQSELPFLEEYRKKNLNDQKVGEEGRVHGSTEMTEGTDAMISACNPNGNVTTTIDGNRKRKGGNGEGGMRVKLLRYHHTLGSPIKNFSPFQNEIGLIRRN